MDGANDIINRLIIVEDKTSNSVDALLYQGRLEEAEESLASVEAPRASHSSLVIERSDSRLMYYVARKSVLKLKCHTCEHILLVRRTEAKAHPLPSEYTEQCDWGGHLYSSQDLCSFIEAPENIFTECFSVSSALEYFFRSRRRLHRSRRQH